jgi:RsiW-degrading membrane proteinase PrsW (M82 family)
MLLLIALVGGLIPGFAWMIFYLGEDPNPEPKRMIVFTFLVGMAFGFFTIAIENIFNNWTTGLGVQELSILSLVGLAFIEEVMKFAAAHFAVYKSPDFDEPIDAMIYMVVAALGFATLENIGSISNISPAVAYVPAILQTLSLRFIGATLLHTLTSAIIGYQWALGIVHGKVKEYLVGGIIIATVLHACFNYLILTYGDLAYSVVFLVLIGFFVLSDFEKLKVAKINIIQ